MGKMRWEREGLVGLAGEWWVSWGVGCADGCGGCGGRSGLWGRELECGVMVVCVCLFCLRWIL